MPIKLEKKIEYTLMVNIPALDVVNKPITTDEKGVNDLYRQINGCSQELAEALGKMDFQPQRRHYNKQTGTQLVAYVKEHPNCVLRDVVDGLGLPYSTTSKTLHRLTLTGELEATGMPKRYSVPEIDVEPAEQSQERKDRVARSIKDNQQRMNEH